MSDSRRLTIMLRVDDSARADMALTPERIYYRFATDDSIEDGELPPAKKDFDALQHDLITAATALPDERKLGPEVKVEIFVQNRLQPISVSEQSLRRLVAALGAIADEFAFLGGFC